MDSGAAAPDPNRAGSAVPGVADGSSSATPHMQGDSQMNTAAHPRSGADPNAATPTSPQNERLSGEMPASISEGEREETPVQNKENKAPEQLDSANDARANDALAAALQRGDDAQRALAAALQRVAILEAQNRRQLHLSTGVTTNS